MVDRNKIIYGSDLFGNSTKPSWQGIVREKFIIPPFSVINTREGFWQKRKSNWLSLGIKSELGRNGIGDTCFSSVNYFNEGKNIAGDSGSIFDQTLSELMYSWFCPKNGKILDPFAGGSVRGIVAGMLGYKYTGIELREIQVIENRKQANIIFDEKDNDVDNINVVDEREKPVWIIGDSNYISEIVSNKYDFIFSCPPYYDLEVYSDLEGELSNKKTYEEFLNEYQNIIKECVNLLKENRFACFVVGDIRDKKGFYRNFVGDTIQAFLNAGMKLYNEAILVTPVGSACLRVNKQFDAGRKLVKTHQNILIFYKGNTKLINKEIVKKTSIEL